jgi:peroxiredoxin
MTKTIFALCAALMMMLSPVDARAADPANEYTALPVKENLIAIGQPAPGFTAIDSNGKTIHLSDYNGQIVILEWTNHGCPFVRKFYDTKTMQKMQQDAKNNGIVWLSIVSSAEGKQGFTTPKEANELIAKEGSNATARILDVDGSVGRLYGAATTPHMYVINTDGTLVYAGAMDDQNSVSHGSLKNAKNYVNDALADLKAGQEVKISSSKPYGCAVKY